MLFAPKEKGQGLTEYALLIAFVIIIAVIVVWAFGGGLEDLINQINGSLSGL